MSAKQAAQPGSTKMARPMAMEMARPMAMEMAAMGETAMVMEMILVEVTVMVTEVMMMVMEEIPEEVMVMATVTEEDPQTLQMTVSNMIHFFFQISYPPLVNGLIIDSLIIITA